MIVSAGDLDGTQACRDRVDAARAGTPRAIIGRLGDVSDGALALLRARGLTHVLAEVGGPTDEAHAFTVPDAAPLPVLLAAARAARAHGLLVIVEAPITRSSAPSLVEVARIAASLPALAFAVRLPAGPASPYPSLPLVLGHVRAALDEARRAGVFPLLIDAPRCLAGPFAPVTVRETERARATACLACAARGSCAGVDEAALFVALPGMSIDLPIPERGHTLAALLAAAHRRAVIPVA